MLPCDEAHSGATTPSAARYKDLTFSRNFRIMQKQLVILILKGPLNAVVKTGSTEKE